MKRGFTLIELLVVTLVIGILAGVAWVVLKPAEIIKKSHDADRVIDFSDLRQAINTVSEEATQSGALVLCSSSPVPCNDFSNQGSRGTDGSGWIKVNLGRQKSVNLPSLPIDPLNNDLYHYSYCGNGESWELNTKLESEQEQGKMKTDGGDDENLYEVGTNLALISPSGGVCKY